MSSTTDSPTCGKIVRRPLGDGVRELYDMPCGMRRPCSLPGHEAATDSPTPADRCKQCDRLREYHYAVGLHDFVGPTPAERLASEVVDKIVALAEKPDDVPEADDELLIGLSELRPAIYAALEGFDVRDSALTPEREPREPWRMRDEDWKRFRAAFEAEGYFVCKRDLDALRIIVALGIVVPAAPDGAPTDRELGALQAAAAWIDDVSISRRLWTLLAKLTGETFDEASFDASRTTGANLKTALAAPDGADARLDERALRAAITALRNRVGDGYNFSADVVRLESLVARLRAPEVPAAHRETFTGLTGFAGMNEVTEWRRSADFAEAQASYFEQPLDRIDECDRDAEHAARCAAGWRARVNAFEWLIAFIQGRAAAGAPREQGG